VLIGLLLFGLSVFFFAFGVIPYWFKVHKHLSEILGCRCRLLRLIVHVTGTDSFAFARFVRLCRTVGWALTFPNVGWISTLRVLGDALHIPGFYAVHAVMAVLMCMVWVVLFGLTAIAFWKGKIFLADEEDVLRDEKCVADDAV
jgi:hypothetical protein